MPQNNLPQTLPSVERFLQRVKSAEKSQAKDIRISIQEAREMTSDLAILTSKLGETIASINQLLTEIRDSTTKIDVKFDGGDF